jgi:hypothetical protein
MRELQTPSPPSRGIIIHSDPSPCIPEYYSYCKSDFVLASVARLHEVLGGGNVGAISGLTHTSEEVTALGIENVDLSNVMQGAWTWVFGFQFGWC